METYGLDAEITNTIYQHCAQRHCRWSSRQAGPLSSAEWDPVRAQHCSAIHICTAHLFHLPKQVYGRRWHGVSRRGGDETGGGTRGGEGEDEEPLARVRPCDRNLACYHHHGRGVFGVCRIGESMKHEAFGNRIALKHQACGIELKLYDTKWRHTKFTGSRIGKTICLMVTISSVKGMGSATKTRQ